MRRNTDDFTFNIQHPTLKGSRWKLNVECWALNVFIIFLSSLARSAEPDFSKLPPPAARTVDFAADIKPILEQSCFRCHGPENPKSHFRLDNRESALNGGRNNTDDIVPGNSAKSRLIHYVAGIDTDLRMPPKGKGDPLTTNQIALLRAWIDQGAAWEGEESDYNLSFAPTLGFVSVEGNKSKFREHAWMRDGWRSGVESFELWEKISPDTKFTLSGRALTDDYRAELLIEKRALGFTRFGVEQFRKYGSDTGGYFPGFTQPTFSLDQDLHLDIGRAWFDIGLTLPDWPRMVSGYEYQYRYGDKATLQWGPGSEGPATRNIFPAIEHIDERVNILKFDLDFERGDWRVEDSFRGEWTSMQTDRRNVSQFTLGVPDSLVVDKVHEGWRSFQGANTVRVERQFKDWLYGSGGYLYSHLSADADFSLDTFNPSGTPLSPPVLQNTLWRSQRILLERESHVGNVNALLGPWQSLTLALGVQSEWTRQKGTLEGFEDSIVLPPFPFNFFVPVSALANIDKATVDENAGIRFTRLPFTTLFAEARLQQEQIGHTEDVAADQTYLRHTDMRSEAEDFRVGFDTSPRAWLKFGSHYRYYNKSTDYDDGNPINDIFGYPTFIESRDLTTQEVESRLTVRPNRWLKTTFTHRLVATDYHTTTESLTQNAPGDLSPGGRVFAGNYDAQIFSFNATLTPWRRLYWFTTISYSDMRSVAMHDNSSAVAPYRGETWSVLCHGRYVLTEKTDLTAGYSFSTANFRQHNFTDGLPLGMAYDLHGMQVGLVSHCTKNLTVKLQYGFYRYCEPSSGGANDYTAHAVFASLNFNLP